MSVFVNRSVFQAMIDSDFYGGASGTARSRLLAFCDKHASSGTAVLLACTLRICYGSWTSACSWSRCRARACYGRWCGGSSVRRCGIATCSSSCWYWSSGCRLCIRALVWAMPVLWLMPMCWLHCSGTGRAAGHRAHLLVGRLGVECVFHVLFSRPNTTPHQWSRGLAYSCGTSTGTL